MKKFLLVLWGSFVCFSCATYNCKAHKKKAQQFIEEFYLSEGEYNWQDVFNYTNTLHPKDFSMLKEKYRDVPESMIKESIEMLRSSFYKNKNFYLLCDKEIDLDRYINEETKEKDIEKIKKIDKRDNINMIFVVTDRKIFAFFIFDKHNNLISFFPEVFSSYYGDRVYPVYLEKETLGLINKMDEQP